MEKFLLENYIETLKSEGLIDGFMDISGLINRPVESITFDSREAGPGCLFICKGAGFKPAFLGMAMSRGAFAYVSETPYEGYPGIIVKDIRRAMAIIANMFYGEPWKAFKLIGLTGTKGKSTTLYFLKAILDSYYEQRCEMPMGYISTINTFDGVDEFESHLTTPESFTLMKHFDNARRARLSSMVMEVSSQGLKYDRTYGVSFDIGAFLNYGVDHIGGAEHPDEQDYFDSKMKLFAQSDKILLNLDTDRLEDIIEAAEKYGASERIIAYSAKGRMFKNGLISRYTLRDIHREDTDTVMTVNVLGDKPHSFEMRISIPGSFNAENALCAAAICLEMGVPEEIICEGIHYAKAPGRMELFENKERRVVVISDYAHNILSFDRLFSSVKEDYPGWRIEALFGCPGGKGLARRRELPETAAKYADFVWITEEDPFEEDVMAICEEVYENLVKAGGKGTIIPDREEAVNTAIRNAKPETVIVMTGKGREQYMHRGKEYVEIESDSSMAERLLK